MNFFLLAGTLAAFVTLQFSSFDSAEGVKAIKEAWAAMGVQESQMGNDFLIKYMAWIQAHYNILLLFALPFMALASRIIFKKRGYSLGEHIIIHCFAYGLFTFAILPLLALANPFALGGISQLSMGGIFVIWYSWVYKDLFRLPAWKAFIISILWYILYFVLIFGIIAIVTIVLTILAVLIIMAVKKLGLL